MCLEKMTGKAKYGKLEVKKKRSEKAKRKIGEGITVLPLGTSGIRDIARIANRYSHEHSDTPYQLATIQTAAA